MKQLKPTVKKALIVLVSTISIYIFCCGIMAQIVRHYYPLNIPMDLMYMFMVATFTGGLAVMLIYFKIIKKVYKIDVCIPEE